MQYFARNEIVFPFSPTHDVYVLMFHLEKDPAVYDGQMAANFSPCRSQTHVPCRPQDNGKARSSKEKEGACDHCA